MFLSNNMFVGVGAVATDPVVPPNVPVVQLSLFFRVMGSHVFVRTNEVRSKWSHHVSPAVPPKDLHHLTPDAPRNVRNVQVQLLASEALRQARSIQRLRSMAIYRNCR